MRAFCNQVIIENFFEPCVLYLLLQKPGYGYELLKELKEHCSCNVNIGNLYRSLARMTKEGHVTKTTVSGTRGPAKAIYTITPSGKLLLHTWIQNLTKQTTVITNLITNYQTRYERSNTTNI